ncbi:phage tail protein [Paenibacillus arenosi]|uniref:Phage tail protein n=1 Tax=Paenibacillus arenosi TaxID=2774142 RepID=A0ABR9AZ92_9BACL|nr:tail fiber protein [Paenibacillus arenosi]MBD8499465.1 phage tail protein [Paenibacillus arenosi]
MAEAYLGEIRIFSGNFAPNGWALCNGQLMPIARYTALFSILGVQYGGDGRSTFALPNLMGQAPMHQGHGPGLTPRTIGEQNGSPTVTLLQTEIPSHTHIPQAINDVGSSNNPEKQIWAQSPKQGRPGREEQNPLYDTVINTPLSPHALQPTGGSLPHNNMQPYLAQTFIICLAGVFPPRG